MVRALCSFSGAALCNLVPGPCHAGFPGNVFEAVGSAAQTVTEGAKKLNDEATNAGRAANTAVTDVATKANTEATNGAKAVNTKVTDTVAKANTQATEVLTGANTFVTNGVQHAAEQAAELNRNIKSNLEKAGKDAEAEVGRVGRNLEDSAQAIGRYLERQGQGVGQTLSNAERRVREGKVVDALWHLSTEPLQRTSDNAALAVQESAYLNTIAQVAATAYGGPAGAAAYASWLTYKQTGNADLALRAGILTYATSSAFASAGEMKAATATEIAKKAAVTASIGGLAVAAAGGDETAIQQGFLKAGAMVLVQDGYRRVTGSDIDGRSSEGEAYCMTAQGETCSPPDSAYVKDANGNIVKNAKGDPVIDMSKVDPRRPHVGTMSGSGTPHWSGERGAFMTSVSRIPGMNAMSVFHDQWAVSWDMPTMLNASTIVPAIVLTYTGTGTDYYEHLRRTAVKAGQPSIGGVQEVVIASVPASAASGTLVTGSQQQAMPGEKLFKTSSAVLSVTCASEADSSTFLVDVPDGGAACRVVEFNATNTTSTTVSSVEGCVAEVRQQAKKRASEGASCFSRSATDLLNGHEPPPQVREAVNALEGKRFPSYSRFSVGLAVVTVFALLAGGVGYALRELQHQASKRRVARRGRQTAAA